MALLAVESASLPLSKFQQIRETGLWLGRQILYGANVVLSTLETTASSVWTRVHPFITSRYGPVAISLTATTVTFYALNKAHNENAAKSKLVYLRAMVLLSGVGMGIAVGRSLYLPV